MPTAASSIWSFQRPGRYRRGRRKATDIAHNCGLASIERIERGIAFRVVTRDGAVLSDAERAALLPQIHDRMTEAVYGSLADASRLFRTSRRGRLRPSTSPHEGARRSRTRTAHSDWRCRTTRSTISPTISGRSTLGATRPTSS